MRYKSMTSSRGHSQKPVLIPVASYSTEPLAPPACASKHSVCFVIFLAAGRRGREIKV